LEQLYEVEQVGQRDLLDLAKGQSLKSHGIGIGKDGDTEKTALFGLRLDHNTIFFHKYANYYKNFNTI
jgi:hypothetical protein